MSRVLVLCCVGVLSFSGLDCGLFRGRVLLAQHFDLPPSEMPAEPYLIDHHHGLRGRVFPADLISIGTTEFPTDLFESETRRMAVEFAEVKRVCELDSRQELQLETAGRGAVLDFVNQRWKDKAMASAQALRSLPISNRPNNASATKHEIWTDALKSFLTDKQRRLLTDARKQRMKFAAEAKAQQQIAAAYRAVVLLDKALQLNNAQQKLYVETLATELVGGEESNPSRVEMSAEAANVLFDALDEKQRSTWRELQRTSVVELNNK